MTLRILIASPSSLDREAMISVLNKAGYSADLVTSPEEAMGIKDGAEYDLVVIDADFVSQGQGWLLAKRLRHWDKDLGIIMLTRLSSPMSFIHDLEYRDIYDQVLKYPIAVEELLGNIERVIGKKKAKTLLSCGSDPNDHGDADSDRHGHADDHRSTHSDGDSD